MIDNIQNRQITQVMGQNGLPRAYAANKRLTDDSDATLQVNFADLINQAAEASDTDADAVHKARKMIASGLLTSPEILRSVAEEIVNFSV